MVIFTASDWFSISIVILIMGMSKGGFPVAGIALPLLVLLWPEQGEAARSAVSFMLPLLCAMDLAGAWMYRKNVSWNHIRKLLPGMLFGVLVASFIFVADEGIVVSDHLLKLTIGILGLSFSALHFFKKKISILGKKLPEKIRPTSFAIAAGITSTIAHAAGPVMQMYFLPTKLSKTVFAGTTVYFFLILNAVKLAPFAFYGRFNSDQLLFSIYFLPLVPIGVLLGYYLVKVMRETHYKNFIHITLAVTSLTLIVKSLFEF